MAISDIQRDRALFARIAEGDAVAFRNLFDTYYPALRYNALKLLKSEYWAEEVAQEVLLQVWDNRDALKEIENPGAWMYRVGSNKCFDRGRRQELEIRAQYIINSASCNKDNSEQDLQYDYNLLQKLIREAVSRLPEQQQLVYKLQQEEELSYKEISERLQISPHTVRNHLIRAFQSVRNFVLTHGEFLVIFLHFLFFL